MSDLNDESKKYLADYREGGIAQTYWTYTRELEACKLDFSEQSLARLQTLLLVIHKRADPDELRAATPGMKNLVKIATYYIGYYLAMKGEFSIHWYSRAAFATAFPDQAPPDEPWSEVMVLIDGYMHAPMGTVLDVLANGASAMSVYQYVSIKLERLTPAPPLDENENCQRFMRATQSGATQGVDVRYLDRIRDIQPDYSLRSIERLNILLGKIRSEDPLDFNAFMHSEGHFNFLLWCSFYLGSTISRIARTQMKWLSYEQAKQADPGLEREIVTHHVCLLNYHLLKQVG